jgi:hypothetical protein
LVRGDSGVGDHEERPHAREPRDDHRALSAAFDRHAADRVRAMECPKGLHRFVIESSIALAFLFTSDCTECTAVRHSEHWMLPESNLDSIRERANAGSLRLDEGDDHWAARLLIALHARNEIREERGCHDLNGVAGRCERVNVRVEGRDPRRHAVERAERQSPFRRRGRLI